MCCFGGRHRRLRNDSQMLLYFPATHSQNWALLSARAHPSVLAIRSHSVSVFAPFACSLAATRSPASHALALAPVTGRSLRTWVKVRLFGAVVVGLVTLPYHDIMVETEYWWECLAVQCNIWMVTSAMLYATNSFCRWLKRACWRSGAVCGAELCAESRVRSRVCGGACASLTTRPGS